LIVGMNHSWYLLSLLVFSSVAGCGEEPAPAGTTEERPLLLTRADGAGGDVAAGALITLALFGEQCRPGADCVSPQVESVSDVAAVPSESAATEGAAELEGGTARLTLRTQRAGEVTVTALAETHVGTRSASYSVDVVVPATIEFQPECPSQLGGQTALRDRLAVGFAVALDTSLPIEVAFAGEGGQPLTGYDLAGVGSSAPAVMDLTPSQAESGTATLVATEVGSAEILALYGPPDSLGVQVYEFDEVDGFLYVSQVGDAEPAFTPPPDVSLGTAVRLEAIPTVGVLLACTVPFAPKYVMLTPEVCVGARGETTVQADWVEIETLSGGDCTVEVNLQNANGRGHTREVQFTVN
jgi:hypothetical protein